MEHALRPSGKIRIPNPEMNLMPATRQALHATARLLGGLLLAALLGAAADAPLPMPRALLVEAVLSEDAAAQAALVRRLASRPDPSVEQGLAAWRLGNLYLFEAPDGAKIPFLLDSATDTEGRARGLRLLDGEALKDPAGKPLLFTAADITAALDQAGFPVKVD